MSVAIVSAIVALAGLVVTLAVLVWKFGAVFGESKAALAELRKDVEEIGKLKDTLADMAALRRELAETREAVRRLVSEWPRMDKRVSILEWEAGQEKTSPGMEPRAWPPKAPRAPQEAPRPRMGSKPRIPREDEE